MQAEGAGYTYFYRDGPPELDHLKGRILRQADASGGVWNFEYLYLEAPSGLTAWPRLHKICLNGSSEIDSDAVVVFNWDIGTTALPGTGLLRSVYVYRPHEQPNGARLMVNTQYVKYSYRGDEVDGFLLFLHLGGSSEANHLVLVETGSAVNPTPLGLAWSSAGLQYERRFTHFRYLESIRVVGGRWFGVLTHRLEPEQVQFYAEKWIAQNPGGTLDDAVQAMMTDQQIDTLIPGEPIDGLMFADLASKIVSYYGTADESTGYPKGSLAFKVREQTLQAACGCSSGGIEKKTEQFAYSRKLIADGSRTIRINYGNAYTQTTFWTYRESSVTKITEIDAEDNPVRKTLSWSEEQTLIDGTDYIDPATSVATTWQKYRSPFVIGNRVEEHQLGQVTRTWDSFHDFHPTQMVRRKRYHPSAVIDVTLHPDDTLMYPMPSVLEQRSAEDAVDAFTLRQDDGFVEWWEYNDEGRVEKLGFQRGATGTPVATKEFEYLPIAGRKDLITKETILTGSGSPDIVTEYLYELEPHNSLNMSDPTAASVKKRTTRRELESPAENGPSSTALTERIEFFDPQTGRPTETREETGKRTIYGYSVNLSGAVIESPTDDWLTATVDSWTDPAIPAQTVSRVVDATGQTRAQIAPDGSRSYTEYRLEPYVGYEINASSEPVLSAASNLSYLVQIALPHDSGVSASPRFNGPAVKQWVTSGRNILRTSSYEVSSLTAPASRPHAAAWQLGQEVARAIHRYGPTSSLYESRTWHDLDAASVASGSDLVRFNYDAMGRLIKMISAEGAVVETKYDGDDRVIAIYGYQEAPSGPTPPMLLSENFYDHVMNGAIPAQGVGEGNLTLSRAYVGGGPPRDDVTIYDWRNRQRASYRADPADVTLATPMGGSATVQILDNADRPVQVATLRADDPAGSGATLSQLVPQLKSDTLGSLFGPLASSVTVNHYGRRGLVFATETAIDPTDTSDPEMLRTDFWYNDAGQPVTSLPPNGPATKLVYDGLGRTKNAIVTDGGVARNGGSYEAITDPLCASDVILEQTETDFDALGRPALVRSDMRQHLAAGVGLGASPISTFAATVYDTVSRPIATVLYGTNTALDEYVSGGVSPGILTTVPDPLSNPSLIISQTAYDQIGRVQHSIDPEGRKTKVFYDDAGRTIGSAENWTDAGLGLTWDATKGHFVVTGRVSTNPAENRVSSAVYDGDGNTVRRVAHLVHNGVERTQVTEYSYDPADALSEDLSVSYGRLAEIRYPRPGATPTDPYLDPDAGNAGTADEDTVQFASNLLGEQIASRDQNGTRRSFVRDALGRLTSESVTATLPVNGVDLGVTKLVTGYDPHGRIESVASLDASDTVLNEVRYAYNARGDLINLDQNPLGAVSSGVSTRSLSWNYIFADADNGNEFRVESMQYPDGSKLAPAYGDWDGNPLDALSTETPTTDSPIDRVRAFWWVEPNGAAQELARYTHLGAGTVAKVAIGSAVTGVVMDRTAAANGARDVAGSYPGWDRFGRLKLNSWVHADWAGPSMPQVFQEVFEYDRVSNRSSKDDLRTTAFRPDRDWDFAYDGLNRLVDAARGIQTDGVSTTDKGDGSREWTLDELGNWSRVSTLSGSTLAHEDRIHNATNELVEVDGEADPREYDPNGNLIFAKGRRYVYDAWNRLVRVHAGDDLSDPLIAEYDYNAIHWRVRKWVPNSDGVSGTERWMVYSPSWQLLFEDVIEVDTSGATTLARTGLQAWGKRSTDDALYRAVDDSGDGTHDREFFYQTDSQFSMTAVLHPDGRLRPYERVIYDAYGSPTHEFPEDFYLQDGVLNYFDIQSFNSLYNAQSPRADLDHNGLFNFFDFAYNNWAFNNKKPVLPGAISDSDAAGPDNRIGYMGYLWDHEAGMWLGRHRVFDPAAGRWMQRDPAGYVDGLSMYLFVRGNPLSLIDPMGLFASEPGWTRRLEESQLQRDLGMSTQETQQMRSDATSQALGALTAVVSLAILDPSDVIVAGIVASRAGGFVRAAGKVVRRIFSRGDEAAEAVGKSSDELADAIAESKNASEVSSVVRESTESIADSAQSGWRAGRYADDASKANAYNDSGKRVFPTLKNSGLSGDDLRKEQESFVRRRLNEGASPEEIRGQAANAGLTRRVTSTSDELADRGADKAVNNAVEAFKECAKEQGN